MKCFNFWMLYISTVILYKKLSTVVKVQNGGFIQDSVENVHFLPNIFKNDIFVNFKFFLFTLGKNKTFTEKLFS
jgi:hypothetical protein